MLNLSGTARMTRGGGMSAGGDGPALPRVLLIQPLPGIGDMVWHLPAIHAVAGRARGGQVSLLTKRRSLADRLLAADPAIGEVLWLDRQGRHGGLGGLWRLAGDLRRRSFDEVWLFHQSARYALACWLAGIPRRVGFGFGMQRLWLSEPGLGAGDRRRHPIEKARLLLAAKGLPQSESEPVLPVADALEARMQAALSGLARPWIALGIGSSEPDKQWGAARFARLAGHLPGTLFLVGGTNESGLAGEIVAASGNPRERLVRVTDRSIDEVAALLAACDVYVGNDTGVLNLAAAVGTPAIGLFGASPPLTHSARIQCVLPEQGDGEAGMAGIGVARVAAAVVKTLGKTEC